MAAGDAAEHALRWRVRLTRLVVRLRHLHPPDTGLGENAGATRTTSKLLVLAELLNLTFDLEPHVGPESNAKFAPLAAC